MKKLLLMLMMIASLTSIAYAELDLNYFNGDENYIYCGASMGAGFFVDRNSLVVEEYDPPIYILSIDVLMAGHYYDDSANVTLGRRRTSRFKYDYSTRKMYLYTPNGDGKYLKERYENQYRNSNRRDKLNEKIDWNSDWTYVDPDVYYGEGAVFPTSGEIAFALAYNLKFHGSKYKRFSGNFYDKIGNVKDSL